MGSAKLQAVKELSVESIFREGGILSQQLDQYEYRQPQERYARAVELCIGEDHNLIVEAGTGCHVSGQEILMFDGSVKCVENIVVGDRLMGPDSQPRDVLSLRRGNDRIVRVVPVKGDPWDVNSDHILTLVRTNTGSGPRSRSDCLDGEVVDVSVKDWECWSKYRKNLYKLFRVGVDFKSSDNVLPIKSYHLGVLLGDGGLTHGSSVTLTKKDKEIGVVADEIADFFGLRVSVTKNKNNVLSYRFAHTNKGGGLYHKNMLIRSLESLRLRVRGSDKFIPYEYKISSREDRLNVLAGLLDTDGGLSCNTYDYISSSKQLSCDVVFVARSLGFSAYVNHSRRRCQDGFERDYWRVSISGDVEKIPCRLSRKKASPRKQKKSVLRTGFSVENTGRKDDYYGFVLSGDGRYLLGDFTVTHNTGKSFGYLVPAIMDSVAKGTCAVVATANIALQEQLVNKDLPFLKQVLPIHFEYGLVKGRSNYLCMNQLDHQKNTLNVKTDDEKHIEYWADRTKTGDKSELEIEPSSEVWSRYSVTAEECISCKFKDDCYANVAKERLKSMNIVVCNYHLLLAHVKVRMETGKDVVLPGFDVLVCDEGHKMADIARSFLGWELGYYMLSRLGKKLNTTIKAAAKVIGDDEYKIHENKTLKGMRSDSKMLHSDGKRFFDALGSFHGMERGGKRIHQKNKLKVAAITNTLREVASCFAALAKVDYQKNSTDVRAECRKKRDLARRYADGLEEANELADGNAVYYTEYIGKSKMMKLVKRKIDVADILWQEVFEGTKASIVTSATLAIESEFGYVRKEMGLKKARELVVDSPFDYQRQCMLIVSHKAPDPTDKENYTDRVCKALAYVIGEAKGRTLGLFTSYKNLNAARDYLRENVTDYTILCQGDAPRMKLVEQFREDVSSVLLGTESFWAGVDVPGEALSCLVIDRIPFRSPGDPVWDEMCDRSDNWFWDLSIPAAAIQFKQGTGRLIRRKTDKGVIVILDRRMATKRYGEMFVNSLPRMMRARTLKGSIRKFLGGEQ